jgi:hypothetical protein
MKIPFILVICSALVGALKDGQGVPRTGQPMKQPA